MRNLLRKHQISFKNAFSGLDWAVKTQPNFRIHLILSVLAIVLCIGFSVSYIEMTVILFTIVLGLSAEMINTSIEAMTDLITKEWRQEAKIAKDVSAGMMLLVSFGATLVAWFVFVPYLLRYIE
jgi:diacylglycerol kinase (ATP)